jgi:hypothetical protein
MELRPLLGIRYLISKNKRLLLGNGSVNTFPWELLAYENEWCCPRGSCNCVIRKRTGATKSVLYGRLWRKVFKSQLKVGLWKQDVMCEVGTAIFGVCDSVRPVIIACTYELCVWVANKSNIQSKAPSIVIHITRQYVCKNSFCLPPLKIFFAPPWETDSPL